MAPSRDPEPSSSTSSTPKIAIKGFSLSAKPKAGGGASAPKPKAATSSLLGKRSRATLHGDEEDSDSDGGRLQGHEAVTGFGAEGAIRREQKKEQAPLVIPRMGNKDWRAEMKRKREDAMGKGKNLLPPEVQAQRNAQANAKMTTKTVVETGNTGEGEPAWGLTVTKRQKVERSDHDDFIEKQETTITTQAEEEQPQPPAREKTDNELALEALLGVETEKKGPALVIAASERVDEGPPLNEADAYRRAIASAPDVSTLEDYERVPVEEFGAALLRGMGWKEGSKVERPKEVKRRQNLLGLGASQLKDAEELGAWVQKTDTKRLQTGGGGGGGGGSRSGNGHSHRDRPPKLSDYRREKEQREERREERNGGGYRRERERERDRDGHGHAYRERDRRR
ncbi:pre-mRNA-splicing factor SPP2 [Phlyctema vagabunda]|uniref:Pre-mRNA-splicing factor n=1 Tax=Phlyctema vagabunda TaxID=108571 RepID=A0ABR4P4E0_9HELO